MLRYMFVMQTLPIIYSVTSVNLTQKNRTSQSNKRVYAEFGF